MNIFIKKLSKCSLLSILLISLSFSNIFANTSAHSNRDDAFLSNSVEDLTSVALAGVGGAVLGLSTLSFVEEPSDHTSNILVGAAIGVIIGVAYVAIRTAGSGKQYYEKKSANIPSANFSTKQRLAWHNSSMNELNLRAKLNQSDQLSNQANWLNFSYRF